MLPFRQAARRLSTRPVLRTAPLPKNTVPNRYLTVTRSVRAATAAQKGDHASDATVHDSHDSHYDPPGGWLWGIRPGEKAEREGWEIPFYVMCAGYIVAIVAYTMKEDTSIQTWALEEARRRLEKEGLLEDPNPSGSS